MQDGSARSAKTEDVRQPLPRVNLAELSRRHECRLRSCSRHGPGLRACGSGSAPWPGVRVPPRSAFYAMTSGSRTPEWRPPAKRRGPKPAISGGLPRAAGGCSRPTLRDDRPPEGEGYRKVWARLRVCRDIRVARKRVLRLMPREHPDALAPSLQGAPVSAAIPATVRSSLPLMRMPNAHVGHQATALQ